MKKYLYVLLATALLVGGYVYADSLNDIQIQVHNGTSFVPFGMTPNTITDTVLVYDKDAEIYRLADADPSFLFVQSGILRFNASDFYTKIADATSSIATINVVMAEIAGNLASSQSTMLAGNSSAPNRGLVTAAERALLNSLATVATTGSYNDLTDKPVAATSSSRTFANPARSLNTCFLVSTTTDALVTYSVDIAATLSLTTGQVGTVFLEYSDNSTCTTNTVEVARATNGNAGTLTVGLALTQTASANVGGMVPGGKYVRIRTSNVTGSPSFNFRSSQEVKF